MSRQPDAPNLTRLAVINEDGSRRHVHPADVTGKFSRLKPWIRGALIAVYLALPWIPVGAHPAVFLNITDRKFYLFGLVFNAQDAPLLFFMLTGAGFTLIVATALYGRVWCGWACPQTVFLDGVFRRIERLIDGPRADRLRLADAPWTSEKVFKRVLKQVLFVLVSLAISHSFVAYFVSIPGLYAMMSEAPADNWVTFLWMAAITGALYFNFAWFREQLCLIICPYGRLQSALQDDDTLIIGYDEIRGEPRGKAKDPNAGACVNCQRCIAVCPTGIDIRQGLQMECIGCAACIDACDDIMGKLGRPKGLVRYDTHRGFTTGERRFVRPRLLYYAVAGLVGFSVAAVMVSRHEPFEANMLRVQGSPYVVTEGVVLNQVMIHVVNKATERTGFAILSDFDPTIDVTLPQPEFELPSLGSHQVPVLLRVKRADLRPDLEARFRVVDTFRQKERRVSIRILGPPPQADAEPKSADPSAADPNAAGPNAADPNAADPNAAAPNAADPNKASPQAPTSSGVAP